MKPSRTVNNQNGQGRIVKNNASHSETLSRQIENLRVVLRRMKTSESAQRDSFISQKLRDL